MEITMDPLILVIVTTFMHSLNTEWHLPGMGLKAYNT